MTVVAVFEHPPGRGGKTQSYIIGDVRDVLSRINWGKRKLGKFVEIVQAWDGCPEDPYYVLVWSFSLQSKSAQAMLARETLKAALPISLRRLVSLARRINARPKYTFLEIGQTTDKSKCDLFFERFVTEHDRVLLSSIISLNDFWNAATGRMNHNQIEEKLTRQLEFQILDH